MDQSGGKFQESIAIVAITAQGFELARQIRRMLPGACIHALETRLAGSQAEEFFADTAAHLRGLFYEGVPIIDLDYTEDSRCDTDMNVVMTGSGGFIEVQGTAEGVPFSAAQMQALIALAQQGIAQLIAKQKAALGVA